VDSVYLALAPEERRDAAIISTNYGEAGALELYGPELGLPRVFATHKSFHSWGPPPDSTRIFIAVFVDRHDLERMFDSVVEAKVHTCSDCTQPQRLLPIYVARGPHFSFKKEWPKFRIFD
jgi:hypothetical protein